MGYTTDFWGEITLDKPLTEEQETFINTFSATRRMKRDVEAIESLGLSEDSLHNSVGLPLGIEGEFFVRDDGDFGQSLDTSIIDYNKPPTPQPGLWCQWVIEEDGERNKIVHDGGEKFYNYGEWMKYIIQNFIATWGLVANGEIRWSGEEADDMGIIKVVNNKVEWKSAEINW
jgi:hypothetical protein